ncbi:hypothetical protein ACFSTD_00370 [Novosphingobium colocasiae]
MGLELTAAIEHTDADDDLRAVVVTGSGSRAFCPGADLSSGQEASIMGPYGWLCSGQGGRPLPRHWRIGFAPLLRQRQASGRCCERLSCRRWPMDTAWTCGAIGARTARPKFAIASRQLSSARASRFPKCCLVSWCNG